MTMPSATGSEPPERLVPLPRDEGQALRVAEADEGDYFVWRLGKSDGQRARAKRREPVAFIRREALRLHEHAPGGEDGGEALKGGGHGSVQ